MVCSARMVFIVLVGGDAEGRQQQKKKTMICYWAFDFVVSKNSTQRPFSWLLQTCFGGRVPEALWDIYPHTAMQENAFVHGRWDKENQPSLLTTNGKSTNTCGNLLPVSSPHCRSPCHGTPDSATWQTDLHEARTRLINEQENALAWERECQRVTEQGKLLYSSYLARCNRLKHTITQLEQEKGKTRELVCRFFFVISRKERRG